MARTIALELSRAVVCAGAALAGEGMQASITSPDSAAVSASRERVVRGCGAIPDQRTRIPASGSQCSAEPYFRSGASGTAPIRTPRFVPGGPMATNLA